MPAFDDALLNLVDDIEENPYARLIAIRLHARGLSDADAQRLLMSIRGLPLPLTVAVVNHLRTITRRPESVTGAHRRLSDALFAAYGQ